MSDQVTNCELNALPIRDWPETSRTVPRTTMWRWTSFAAGLTCIGAVWLLVLPLIGDVPAVADHISLQKQGNIDPSAMFYTDLAIAPAVAARAERIHAENLESFWGRPTRSPSP